MAGPRLFWRHAQDWGGRTDEVKDGCSQVPDVQTQRGRRGSRKWGVVTAGRPGAPRLTPPGPCSRFHVCH